MARGGSGGARRIEPMAAHKPAKQRRKQPAVLGASDAVTEVRHATRNLENFNVNVLRNRTEHCRLSAESSAKMTMTMTMSRHEDVLVEATPGCRVLHYPCIR